MIDLDKLEELEKKATEGPWTTIDFDLVSERDDVPLILAARNALPGLIAELRSARWYIKWCTAEAVNLSTDNDRMRLELDAARDVVQFAREIECDHEGLDYWLEIYDKVVEGRE